VDVSGFRVRSGKVDETTNQSRSAPGDCSTSMGHPEIPGELTYTRPTDLIGLSSAFHKPEVMDQPFAKAGRWTNAFSSWRSLNPRKVWIPCSSCRMGSSPLRRTLAMIQAMVDGWTRGQTELVGPAPTGKRPSCCFYGGCSPAWSSP
jgi:hypothetical protein